MPIDRLASCSFRQKKVKQKLAGPNTTSSAAGSMKSVALDASLKCRTFSQLARFWQRCAYGFGELHVTLLNITSVAIALRLQCVVFRAWEKRTLGKTDFTCSQHATDLSFSFSTDARLRFILQSTLNLSAKGDCKIDLQVNFTSH